MSEINDLVFPCTLEGVTLAALEKSGIAVVLEVKNAGGEPLSLAFPLHTIPPLITGLQKVLDKVEDRDEPGKDLSGEDL